MNGPVTPGRSPALGIGFAVLAMACFSVMDVTNKVLVSGMPLLMALWFRYCFQAVATTVAVLPRRGWSLFETRHLKLHMLRGILLLVCSVLAFISLQHMPVGEFTAIAMLTPLVVTLLARFVMHESVSPLRWLFVVGGMLGALLIVRPGSHMALDAAWLPLTMVVAYAAFQILTSHMARTENPVTMHFYTGWVGTLIASVMVLGWWTTDLSTQQWAMLVLIGITGTLGHYLLILAFAHAPASSITPFLYTGIAFATLAGWVVFSHVPDGTTVVGIMMIVCSGLAAGWLGSREKLPSSP
jgi:drug/metabolite transporter (DMT)-like permease